MSRIKVAELAKKFAWKLSIGQELAHKTQPPGQTATRLIERQSPQYIELDEVARVKTVLRDLNYILSQITSPSYQEEWKRQTRGHFENDVNLINSTFSAIKTELEPFRIGQTTSFNISTPYAQSALDRLLPLKSKILNIANYLLSVQTQLRVSSDLTKKYMDEIEKKLV